MTTESVPVPPQDLYVLLICTVRYALGRRSYIVGDAIDFVRKYGAHLTPGQSAQIVREIEEAIERCEIAGSLLGDFIDHWAWRKFVAEMKEKSAI